MSNKKKKPVIKDIVLKSLQFPDEKGGMSLIAKHPAFVVMIDEFAKVFKYGGGTNYLELKMSHPELGPFTVTIQRTLGISPGEKASKYRTALEKCREKLATAHDGGCVLPLREIVEEGLK